MTDEIHVVSTEDDAEAQSFSGRHPVLIYSALRVALLLAVAAVLFIAGARGLLLIILAFLISGVVSILVLVPQRNRVGKQMGGYFRRLNERIEESKRSEDDIVDAHRAASGHMDVSDTRTSVAAHSDTDAQQ